MLYGERVQIDHRQIGRAAADDQAEATVRGDFARERVGAEAVCLRKPHDFLRTFRITHVDN